MRKQRQAGIFSKKGNDKKANNIYTWYIIEKNGKGNMCSCWKNNPGKKFILLQHARVQAQSNLSPHYFLHNKGIRIVTTMGLLLGCEGKPRISSTVARTHGEP
jgi:hypothetical protein